MTIPCPECGAKAVAEDDLVVSCPSCRKVRSYRPVAGFFDDESGEARERMWTVRPLSSQKCDDIRAEIQRGHA